MSLANVRKHWRPLAAILLLFVVLGALGPILFYGVGPLFTMMMEAPRPLSLALLFLFGAAPAAYFFFSLWAGNKVDQVTLDRGSREAGRDDNG